MVEGKEEREVKLSTIVVKEIEEQVEKKEVNLWGKNVWKPQNFKGEMILGVKW